MRLDEPRGQPGRAAVGRASHWPSRHPVAPTSASWGPAKRTAGLRVRHCRRRPKFSCTSRMRRLSHCTPAGRAAPAVARGLRGPEVDHLASVARLGLSCRRTQRPAAPPLFVPRAGGASNPPARRAPPRGAGTGAGRAEPSAGRGRSAGAGRAGLRPIDAGPGGTRRRGGRSSDPRGIPADRSPRRLPVPRN